jgi:hypothetical protein
MSRTRASRASLAKTAAEIISVFDPVNRTIGFIHGGRA